ncbi:MAG TPA: ASPIC/UnbV domain-containing protein [Polyangia bacterium]|nr:ASPIC/UnbV domain-containing protein [Polyangia bacterium]
MSSQSAAHNAMGNGPRAASRMDLSGRERDRMFVSRAAKDMVELSYLSGADGVEDARAMAVADLDRDGFNDLIVVNRNVPLLRVYHNQVGPASRRHFVGLRVEGARQAQAVGARVIAKACGLTQTREIALGSGFATVNSLSLTLGLDRCAKVDELTVRFPGGDARTFRDVAADKMYRVVEGKGLKELPGIYGSHATPPAAAAATQSTLAAPSGDALGKQLLDSIPAATRGHARWLLVDLFATWCEACVRANPRVEALAASGQGDDKLDLVGVSVEPKDDGAAVARWSAAHGVHHALLPFAQARAAAIATLVGDNPPLPSTLVLDATNGRIVWHGAGLPTRSDLARWRWQANLN